MEIPKILWLKRHMPAERFAQSMFFDLPDYCTSIPLRPKRTPTKPNFTVTYRATANLARSNCSLVCKTSFVPLSVEGSKGWNPEFLSKIGLGDLVSEKFKRIGGTPGEEGSMVLTAGLPVGQGLSEKASEELGL